MAQKLFIGGLSFTTTEDRLRAGFSEVFLGAMLELRKRAAA